MDETDSSRSAALIHPDAIKESIMEFQRFAGLNETGEMDPETSRMMKLPRCGVKDMVGHSKSHGRSKRFALQGRQTPHGIKSCTGNRGKHEFHPNIPSRNIGRLIP